MNEREDDGMTLTEFLLARIAEDEQRGVHDDDCGTWLNSLGYCDCTATARHLAECEAKRRIVAAFHRLDDEALAALRHFDRKAGAVAQVGASVLQLYALQPLATLYSDHPDYRDEWRP